MFGYTHDEAGIFIRPRSIFGEPQKDPAQVYTQKTLENMAKVLAGEHADDILAYFASTDLTPYEAPTELFTSAIWIEPALATYQRFATQGCTSYEYCFARVSPAARKAGMLAFHAAEIPYLFGTLITANEADTQKISVFGTSTEVEDYDEIDFEVKNTIQHAWTEFARTGIPSNPDGTQWPRLNGSNPQFISHCGYHTRAATGHQPGHTDDQLFAHQRTQEIDNMLSIKWSVRECASGFLMLS